jgi:osmotically-inducible protein OsmY
MTFTSRSAHPVHEGGPTDVEVQHDVCAELDSAQHVDSSRVEVAVHHGVVHLDGQVGSVADDGDVRAATVRAPGVHAIVDRLTAALPAA